jgi:hypothetical protein
MEIRTLRANEIELRVGMIKENGCSLLLYKDARVDMKILDEVYGPHGWQRKHEVINGNLFCTIEVWDDEKKQWIAKQDVGVESYTEKEKGQASDAFKRAGFNVGIGRELYTAPFIWISLNKDEIVERGGKCYLKPGINFEVKEIGYNDQREINKLIIVDHKGRVRFELGKIVKNKVESKATEDQMREYVKLTKELSDLNNFDNEKFMKHIKKTYGVNSPAELTSADMEANLQLFRKTLANLKKR